MKKILKCAAALSVAAALSAGCFAACSDSPSEPEIERVDDTRTLTDNEYTVLNLSGTDALGRTFTTADSENGELYVGMFYFLWLGQHGSEMNGIYDVTDITENGENMDAFYYTNSGARYGRNARAPSLGRIGGGVPVRHRAERQHERSRSARYNAAPPHIV